MPSKLSVFIARALWIFPAILLVLTINQIDVSSDLRLTFTEGQLATAEIVGFETSNRADVTFDYVSLRVPLADGTVLQQERMALPHSFAPRLAGMETVEVRVLPGADQPIVLAALGRAHWRMAAINASMCAVGFFLLSIAVFAWNRYLKRKGDPARLPAEADESLSDAGLYGTQTT